MPTSFRFPEAAVLLAMVAIKVAKENQCPWCLGKTYRIKDGIKKFCTPCDGLGTRGGYGRNQPATSTPPLAAFQIPERSRQEYGLL